MLFKSLQASTALNLERYADIDHFRESERYARAESIPLAARNLSVLRASLTFPLCSLSLVRTFPRIIKGYELPGRMILVIPMDDVASTRVNGEAAGSDTLILFKGSASCTVYEPEGRLVAILSFRTDLPHHTLGNFGDGYLLLRLLRPQLEQIQGMVRRMLEFAARKPDVVLTPQTLAYLQALIFDALNLAVCTAEVRSLDRRKALVRYKEIIDRIDVTLATQPTSDPTTEKLAGEIGVSVRTLQTAAQSLLGSGIHHYGRLMRLWSVRRQLRTGAAGLTVKASALANGFRHMGEFSNVYRAAFGESPSETLARSRLAAGSRGYAALAPS